jgi:farnesyl-diphosphate farnesyltransferase
MIARATPDARETEADRFARAIVPHVSRTFALSIRLLPGELGSAVRCAYLLCRIADTLEDAPDFPAEEKAELLEAFAACFDDAALADAFPARVTGLRGEAAHVALVRRSDLVFVAYRALSPATREHVRRWVREMIGGMRKFVLAHPMGIRIQSLDEYREYCYYVAGTVGYLLTDLWHQHSPSIGATKHAVLLTRCRAFAEALQTVNILKDVARDAEHENSIYIPQQLLQEHGSGHPTILAPERAAENRAALDTLIQLAWTDLDEATAYLLAIPRRAVPIRLFCALPLLFAYATLRDLTRAVGSPGNGRAAVVKISRSEVKSLTTLSVLGVLSNRMLAWLVARARTKPLVLVW